MMEMDEQTIIQQLASIKEGDIVREEDFLAISSARALLIAYRNMEAHVYAHLFSEGFDELEDFEHIKARLELNRKMVRFLIQQVESNSRIIAAMANALDIEKKPGRDRVSVNICDLKKIIDADATGELAQKLPFYLLSEISEIRYEAKEETITIPLGLAQRLYEESKEFNIIYAMAKYNQENKIPTLIVTCDPEEQETMWESRLCESYGKCACITLSDVSSEAFSELERYMEA